MTDSEVDKIIDKGLLGPANHRPKFTLTEKRTDVGVKTMQKDYYEKPEVKPED